MADFCESCAEEMGFPPDYSFLKMEEELEPGYAISVLCEGCTMIYIAKKEDGKLIFGYPDPENKNVDWLETPKKST